MLMTVKTIETRLASRGMHKMRPSLWELFQNFCLHKTGRMANKVILRMYACMSCYSTKSLMMIGARV